MLDINLFRVEKGGNPDIVRESQRLRCAPVEIVDQVIAIDKEWIALRFAVDESNKKINLIQKEITTLFKAKQDASSLVEQRKTLETEKQEMEETMKEKESQLHGILKNMGNIVHPSVIASPNEDNNELVRFWPAPIQTGKDPLALPHHQVLARIDGYDPKRGAKVMGHRGYFLKNWGVRLNQALINYGLDFLQARNFTVLQTPFIMLKDVMAKTCQLSDFDDQMYKVVGDSEDKYLIATSEQPISAFHMDESFDNPSQQLPIRYGGISTCFRKEAGAHGKDTWGLFRIHQFEKVEQFVLTAPEKSWEMFEEMIGTSEQFFQSLEIPYRVVGIVGGALNNAAAKKYDLEAWFPSYGEYKELVSCSNCTDYQSRAMNIRCGVSPTGEKRYVHCLNSTLCATERALCCLLEHYQTSEGVRVPEKLQPYLGGVSFIPFTVAA